VIFFYPMLFKLNCMQHEIYLDANATTPVLPAAVASALEAMHDLFGNPSSSHCTGLRAKNMMDAVRARAVRLLGAGEGRMLFVSGATEAIQTAVLSALCAVRERQQQGGRVGHLLLYGATEHKAVPESLAHWNRLLDLHLEIRALPVDGAGQHDLDVLRELAPDAALVCTMAANNETGVVSDLDGIEAVLLQTADRALWLVDCVQALGKLPLDLATTRIDYAAFSGHKLYAPKGVGLLYVRAGAPFTALMTGGGQESGQRSGTENMAGIAALGAVLEALEDGRSFRTHAELCVFRDALARSLREALPGIVFNAAFAKALPTTLNFSVPGFTSKELLDLFDAAEIRVSSGSACSAAKAAPSFVLEAMGLPAWQAASAIRMSFGPATDGSFIHQACERIVRCGQALRASGLVASDQRSQATDGAVQFFGDGASSWLLLDAASHSCIVIDPLPELIHRLAGAIKYLDYRVKAILTRSTEGAHILARQALAHGLKDYIDADIASDSDTGWPLCDVTVTLAKGGRLEAIPLGQHVLARLAQPEGRMYLFGKPEAGLLVADAVQFGFCTGKISEAFLRPLTRVINPGTVICATDDSDTALATTLQAEQFSASDRSTFAIELCPTALNAFLLEHDDTLLVDVREPFERLAGPELRLAGRTPIHIPLSRLVNQLPAWTGANRPPLVFICRSGNRSGKAASCLRRLGYARSWSLTGGWALAGT
jgi:cysteine desulfurase